MKTTRLALSALNSLCSVNVRNLNKETAMSKISILAAICMAVTTFAFAPAASAQTPPAPVASASASVSLGSPPAADAGAPAPKAEASPLFPIPTLPKFINFSEFVRLYYLDETQKGWDATAKKSAKDILKSDTLFGQFSILFTQITEVLEGTGNKVTSDTLKDFTAYLEANDCRKTGEETLGEGADKVVIPTYSAGCKPLLEKISAVYTKLLPKVPEGVRKENAKHVMARVAKYEGPNAIVLAHVALLAITFELPEADRPWKLTDSSVSDFLKGRDVCVTKKDGEKICGKIEKTDQNGVTVNGVPVPLDSIRSICFGSESECKDASGASKPPVLALELRGFYRGGSAPDYDSAGMGGMMGVVRLYPSEFLALQGGIGFTGMHGKSTFGVTKQDSPWGVAGILGARAYLGPRSWLVCPILEGNATIQGKGLGVEGGVGAEVRPFSFPLNFSALITLGNYWTGKDLVVHPENSTESFRVFGPGGTVTAAWNF